MAACVVADALIVRNHPEEERRRQVGLGAVTSLWVLDAVMNLPAGVPVRVSDHSEETQAKLHSAPAGVVSVDGRWVTRLLSPPLTVVGAVVHGTGWRRPLQQVGCFTPFAQRLLLRSKLPPARLIWEALAEGVGVWILRDGELAEVCAPEPFKRLYWKPASWRFAERAYAASLNASPRTEPSRAFADHPTRTTAAKSRPLQPALPST